MKNWKTNIALEKDGPFSLGLLSNLQLSVFLWLEESVFSPGFPLESLGGVTLCHF